MNRAPIMVILLATGALHACAHKTTQPAQPSVADVPGPSHDEVAARVEVMQVSPAPGTSLGRDTTLVARISYSLAGTPSPQCRVSTKFEQVDGRTLTDGTFPNNAYTWLDNDRGVVDLRFPMRYVFDDPQVEKPFRVRWILTRQLTPYTSRIIAQSPFVNFGAR